MVQLELEYKDYAQIRDGLRYALDLLEFHDDEKLAAALEAFEKFEPSWRVVIPGTVAAVGLTREAALEHAHRLTQARPPDAVGHLPRIEIDAPPSSDC